jgi:hypothetical protein
LEVDFRPVEVDFQPVRVGFSSVTSVGLALHILACPEPEPIVEIRLAAREQGSIMMLGERLDHDAQGRFVSASAQHRAVPP